MNKLTNKKSNTKAKAIITVIAILLVVFMSLGTVTYCYRDEAAAFVASIPGLDKIFVHAPIENPYLEEPVKVYASTPLIEGGNVNNIYVNTYDFENVIKSYLNSGVQYSHITTIFEFKFFVLNKFVRDNSVCYEDIWTYYVAVIPFSSLYESRGGLPEGITEDDFIISFYDNSYVYDYYYSSADTTLFFNYGNTLNTVNFVKGFNTTYFDSDGRLLINNLLQFSNDSNFYNEFNSSKPISISAIENAELVKLFGSTPFKAV